MKFKGLTKLALSGVALAAVAATLGTSTYAWYISNTTATVSGAQGSTSQASTEGSLYAASKTMHANGEWGNNVVLDPTGGADYTQNNNLNPVTLATAAKTNAYNTAAGTSISPDEGKFVDKTGTVVADSSAVLTFDYYLITRGEKPVKIQPKLTINNTTTKTGNPAKYAGTQTSYSANNLPTGVTAATGQEFKVDAVYALRVEITNDKAYGAVQTGGTAVDTDSAFSTTVYAADTAFAAYSLKEDMVKGGKANEYYNSIVNGVNLYGCSAGTGDNTNLYKDVAAPSGTWGAFYLVPDQETHLTFRVWLEGTDADCYDSCVNQSFSFDFEFAVAKN